METKEDYLRSLLTVEKDNLFVGNDFSDIEKLASEISHGSENASDLLEDLRNIKRDYLQTWMQVNEDMLMVGEKAISKESLSIQLCTIDWLIDFFEREINSK